MKKRSIKSYVLCALLLPQFKPDVEATELALAFPLPADLKTVVLSKVSAVVQTYIRKHKHTWAEESYVCK